MTGDLDHIKKIFQEDKQEIIKKYNGIGAGIGMRNNVYTIIVYIDDPNVKLLTDLFWKNIPLRMEYTGKFIIYK